MRFQICAKAPMQRDLQPDQSPKPWDPSFLAVVTLANRGQHRASILPDGGPGTLIPLEFGVAGLS